MANLFSSVIFDFFREFWKYFIRGFFKHFTPCFTVTRGITIMVFPLGALI